MFDLTSFINTYVTKRLASMFELDILSNYDILSDLIHGKSILVIGGAGSIGSSFIRALLSFNPAEIVIVDTNENALTELTRSLRSSSTLSGCCKTDIVKIIGQYLPNFEHIETGKSLDGKM